MKEIYINNKRTLELINNFAWNSRSKFSLYLILIFLQVIIGFFVITIPFPFIFLLLVPIPLLLILYSKPFLGYLLLIFSLPFYNINIYNIGGSTDISLLEPAVVFASFGWILRCIRENKIKIYLNVMDIAIFLIIIWIICSFLWTPNEMIAVKRLIQIFTGLTVYYLTTNMIRNKKEFDLVLTAWIILVLVSAVVGFYQFYFEKSKIAESYIFSAQYQRFRELRVTSFFEKPNIIGLLVPLCVIMCLIKYTDVISKKWKGVLLLIIMIAVPVMLTSLSRKSYIALGLGVLYLTIYCKDIRRALFISMTGVSILFILLAYGPFLQAFFLRATSIFLPMEVASSGRYSAWNVGIQLFFQSPIIGHGVGSFYPLSLRYGSELEVMHNFYLQTTVEYGIIGFSLLLFWLFLLFHKYFEHIRSYKNRVDNTRMRGMMAGLLIIIFESFFRPINFIDPVFWGYFGLATIFLKIYSN